MDLIKKITQLNWSIYFWQSFICIYFVLFPVLTCYFDNLSNVNNTSFDIKILSKHFLNISFVFILISYLLCLPFLIFKKLGRILIFIFYCFILYVPPVLDFIHVLLFKARADSFSYFSIFSTNQSEATEFITNYSSLNLILGIGIFCFLPVLCYFIFKKMISYSPLRKYVMLSCFLPLLIASYFTFSKSTFTYYQEISTFKMYSEYLTYKKGIQLLKNSSPNNSLVKVQKSRTNKNETYVIIIGESTSKYHMSLYDYKRKTNPQLMKSKDDLYIFKQVKSSFVHTIESISDMLILKDSSDNITPNTLIDCFNNYGFHSYWLSNQGFLGSHETPISAFAKKTHEQVFISASGKKRYDADVIPELENILNQEQSKKVVFIHLMGTHLDYQNRYPKEFNVFTSENISAFGKHADSYINHYDNAIRYNDYVISEILKSVQKENGINGVVYLSDHGDEVYDFRDFHGHSEPLRSKYMASVPFFVWANEGLKLLKEDKLSNTGNNENLPYSLKNLAHTIQDLCDVPSQYYMESKSFFYEDTTSSSKTVNSDLMPPVDSPNFRSKIWVHRVNSIPRLKEVQDKFDGMEIDIVYENGCFNVRHPPVKSIQLSLDEFLSNVADINQHYFWLDLKNLNELNVNKVSEHLNKIIKKFQLKNKLIIESDQPELLLKLNQNEAFTSYYLPNLAEEHESVLNREISVVHQKMAISRPNAISQNISNYSIMNENFKNQNKLIWALKLDWNDPGNHKRIEMLLDKDPTIKVCLVNFTSSSWR